MGLIAWGLERGVVANQMQRGDSVGVWGFPSGGVYSPPQVDRIWLWVYYNKIPIYPIFCLLQGDYIHLSIYLAVRLGSAGVWGSAIGMQGARRSACSLTVASFVSMASI